MVSRQTGGPDVARYWFSFGSPQKKRTEGAICSLRWISRPKELHYEITRLKCPRLEHSIRRPDGSSSTSKSASRMPRDVQRKWIFLIRNVPPFRWKSPYLAVCILVRSFSFLLPLLSPWFLSFRIYATTNICPRKSFHRNTSDTRYCLTWFRFNYCVAYFTFIGPTVFFHLANCFFGEKQFRSEYRVHHFANENQREREIECTGRPWPRLAVCASAAIGIEQIRRQIRRQIGVEERL